VKKLLSVSALILLLLVGCQDTKDWKLDTSKLTKVEMKDVTEVQAKKIPITYEAPSVKVGLDALPFEMSLPEELPFDAKPFQPPVFNDMTHDGKKLMVEFRTSSKMNDEQQIILMISVVNGDDGFDTANSEQVKLNNDVDAYYLNKSISFKQDEISYMIGYMNENISKEQHKKEIIEIANQMVK
jgi:hypothetical protein